MHSSLDLTVSVSAETWAYVHRRLVYLEALLLRVVRDQSKVQEWFTAADLAATGLPGLPGSKEGITKKATNEHWKKRKTRENGRWLFVYHVSSLPARTFDTMIARILDLPDIDAVVPVLPDLPQVAFPEPRKEPENTAPPWVLPLMRILKTEAAGDIAEAWSLLPERLPPGVPLPTVEEAAKVLVDLGLAG